MFHHKLIELESELLAKELAQQNAVFTSECQGLLTFIEVEVGMKLADPTFKQWRGWLTYRRKNESLIVVRGRAFADGAIMPRYLAGMDVAYGMEMAKEYQHKLDVTPPQELDHLLINFAAGDPPRAMVWYGENIAPYKLFFVAEASYDIEEELKDAVAEGCVWILTKPKELTLAEFLEK